MKYLILTKQFLEQKYIIGRLSTRQIAKKVGCSQATILRHLKKYNIQIRPVSEACKGRISPVKGKHPSEETRRKMSKAKKGKYIGKNNPMYGVHRRGQKSPSWRGGIIIDKYGYKHKYFPKHPYTDHHGYVSKHRLIVEQYLGIILDPKWVVHHINSIKDDNRIENLMVFCCQAAHLKYHKNPKLVKPTEIIFDGKKLVNEH